MPLRLIEIVIPSGSREEIELLIREQNPLDFICVNLAGVVTFLVQGIRPLSWWEANRAKRNTRNAIMLWTGLLFLLVLLIFLSQRS